VAQGTVKRWSLGGRSLKRAFPRKIKPVVIQPVSDDAAVNQNRQVSPEVNRRACTSAAMIGLAISMGASSLLMPRQNDGAVAAEPLATEPTAALPSTYEAAALSSTPEVEPVSTAFSASQSMVEHAVQEGQTLWQLSKLYRISPDTIASANGIAPGSVLHVGQVLRIPVAPEAAAIPQTQTVVASSVPTPAVDAVASPSETASFTVPASQEVKDLLKQKQDLALDRLKQRRD
jgi:LysM repeat protein